MKQVLIKPLLHTHWQHIMSCVKETDSTLLIIQNHKQLLNNLFELGVKLYLQIVNQS